MPSRRGRVRNRIRDVLRNRNIDDPVRAARIAERVGRRTANRQGLNPNVGERIAGRIGQRGNFFTAPSDPNGGPFTAVGPDSTARPRGRGGPESGGGGGEGGGFGGDGDFGGHLDFFLEGGFPTGEPADFLDPELLAQFEGVLARLFESPGFDPALLEQSRNQARGQGSRDLRDRTLRRSEDFAASNIFGSGLQNRDLERIENNQSQITANNLLGIDLENMQAAQRSIDQAISGTTALGGLNQQAQALALQEALGRSGIGLDALGIGVGRELGLEGLSLDRLRLEMERAIQELLLNLQFGAVGPSGSGSGGPNTGPFPPGPGSFPGPNSGGGNRSDRGQIPVF